MPTCHTLAGAEPEPEPEAKPEPEPEPKATAKAKSSKLCAELQKYAKVSQVSSKEGGEQPGEGRAGR